MLRVLSNNMPFFINLIRKSEIGYPTSNQTTPVKTFSFDIDNKEIPILPIQM
jgi:hypothetical protein